MSVAAEQFDTHESEFFTEDENDWIANFLETEGNQFFCKVDADYIADQFNLVGLSSRFKNFKKVLSILLDDPDDDSPIFPVPGSHLHNDSVYLYGLVHARFVLTRQGLNRMRAKYIEGDFGKCPRVLCNKQHVLPLGVSDVPQVKSVKVFCPMCREVFRADFERCKEVDGAFFGRTFAHFFLLNFPELDPGEPVMRYVPKIFGFSVHKSSREKCLGAKKGKANV